ncbi:NBS-LRR type resistance protein [Cucumis melo var. makuwa]|uniref:NBS-LRR type resistance protein n=1 Tax=Cucumis melo var. makuwa TaxID=1194695 RepID=A0A5A7T1N6_CUCMM|nr:NBS-LRR type resistance protein [Cucumis melo var. makuwa]TYJ95900.1 NBS-LRR type resistance protein [Cucumis melo var. makuwa]
MFLQFEDDLDNITGESSSVGDNTGSSSQQTTPTPRRRAQSRLLELERHVVINGRIPMTIAPGAEKPISPQAVRFSQAIGLLSIRCSRPLKSSGLTVIDISKSIATRRRLVPTHQTHWLDVMRIGTSSTTIISAVHSRSNHGRTRLLDRSSLTIIVEGPSRFYNDSMSSLKEEGSRSIVWNCSGKHTFELGHSCRRPPRMRIIKCWNSNLSLPQRVVSHSLRIRYAIRCWVDDQATQKALVGDPSRGPAERRVQAVRRHLVRSPQKKRLNYKLNFMKLWNGLKYMIEIIKH